jgi:hypothetical protein
VFARHSSYHPGALDEQKAAYGKLRGAAGEAGDGPGGVGGSAHHQLGANPASTESSPDTQNASFDQLQVARLAVASKAGGSGCSHAALQVEEGALPHSEAFGLVTPTLQRADSSAERALSLGVHYADYNRLQVGAAGAGSVQAGHD